MSINSGKLSEDHARSRLGRGLAALIGDMAAETSVDRPRGQRRLPTAALRPNPRNPRRNFANAELDELVASLRERGIIQPIIARPIQGSADIYEIIAGERRWRAAQRAGLHEVPVVIVEASDAEALQLAIIENVQRADLNPLEEAEGYRALMEEFGNSQDEIDMTAALETAGNDQVVHSLRQTFRRPCADVDRPAERRATCRGSRRPRSQCASGRNYCPRIGDEKWQSAGG